MTRIGERGANLSGGQKQRISIARAVYSDSDIYLVDDALSALDFEVGRKILDDVFQGYLKWKTRIVVTHLLDFLPAVDRMILMENGQIIEQGTYNQM